MHALRQNGCPEIQFARRALQQAHTLVHLSLKLRLLDRCRSAPYFILSLQLRLFPPQCGLEFRYFGPVLICELDLFSPFRTNLSRQRGQKSSSHDSGESHIFGLPLIRLGTGLKVQLLGSDTLNNRYVHIYRFLHHLNRLVARVLRTLELKHSYKMGGMTNELIPQAPLGSHQLLHDLGLFFQVPDEVLPFILDGFLVSHRRVELVLRFGFLWII